MDNLEQLLNWLNVIVKAYCNDEQINIHKTGDYVNIGGLTIDLKSLKDFGNHE